MNIVIFHLTAKAPTVNRFFIGLSLITVAVRTFYNSFVHCLSFLSLDIISLSQTYYISKGWEIQWSYNLTKRVLLEGGGNMKKYEAPIAKEIAIPAALAADVGTMTAK